MSEHTPGPWSVETEVSHFGERHRVVPANIFLAGTDKELLDNFDPTIEQARANAMLVSAAPEMLAALIDVLGELKSLWLNPLTGMLMTSIYAAIKKATGKGADA